MSRKLPYSRVSVVGLGYIGLPTAAVLAAHGIDVIGVDISKEAVNAINAGRIHIVEPGLAALVQRAVGAGLLRAAEKPEAAEVFVIAVPTPFLQDTAGATPTPDLNYIRAAAESIAPVLKPGDLVILESTSPVGTTEQMSQWLQSARGDLVFPQRDTNSPVDIHIAHCPERVLPGRVLEELVENDRIVGGLSAACSDAAVAFYRRFVRGNCIVTDARTAELTKLTENAFRDTNIAFANEMALICNHLNIDVWELIRLANRHPRVDILNPGPGVGGHCIAVDPWFIVSSAPEQAQLIKQARTVNDTRPTYIVEQVQRVVHSLKNPVIACLGLAFKPDIDDLRESPAMQITLQLAKTLCCELLAVEPNIHCLPRTLVELAVEFADLDSALARADVVVILVDHKEFLQLNTTHFSHKSVIDTRGLLPRLDNGERGEPQRGSRGLLTDTV
ncbi:UDP-N-acetyl-D-mannosamine dehydrogenase [Microbulbifer bruguierae]|uniref:UDP-N-acetyl-D-mannosamine dehydrogenase n=1 Tax=Microbulbifer bruguierae TaxID=3029061 RepID=A0ABY8NH24_9GAMM|nr:UDP-N-acetyl-D-mannosamine dehydrogenase [Microbulbifer bruguierae]WGL18240.1 UDP-N-acetyl-D-mannosamine dehydrogenase [Microbulbifer bruguierae]